jgi:hypothetical protein
MIAAGLREHATPALALSVTHAYAIMTLRDYQDAMAAAHCEGACKSLIAVRFKRSGQRWFETGVVPCLSLRALHLSDRLLPAFDRYQAAHTARIAAA